jgi:protein involved in polysaccharide export with SLBB domain
MARSASFSLLRGFTALLLVVGGLATLGPAPARAQQAEAQAPRDDYVLGAGDAIRIQVFQSPELTVDARVSEAGVISYPLLGPVRIGGMSSTDIEKLIAQRLRDGKFLQSPQVTVNITSFRSQQVSVLGNVTRPGRYPLETTGMRLSEVLSLAGGVTAAGADEGTAHAEGEGARGRSREGSGARERLRDQVSSRPVEPEPEAGTRHEEQEGEGSLVCPCEPGPADRLLQGR